jgi:hypothetical protein
MRNAVSPLKHYRRGPLKSRRSWQQAAGARQAILLSLFIASSGAALLPAASPPSVLRSSFSILTSQFSIPGARPSPAHARLFTPRAAPEGSYQAFVIDSGMDQARPAVMKALGVGDAPPAGGGPWAVARLESSEAFGASGIYDANRLARLFNGRRAFVCRGPVGRGGRVVASVSLISPYPDATLSRLEPGTLVIIFDVEAARR